MMPDHGRRDRYLSRCPPGWPKEAIRALGVVQAGKALAAQQEATSRPYLRVANVFDGRIDTSDVKSMPFSDEEWSRYRLTPGDLLLNEGQSLHLVGRAAMYQGAPSGCAFQNALIRFKAGPKIAPAFALALFRYFQQSGVFAEISLQTTTVAHLGVSRFAGLCVAVPSLPEQRKIAAILASVDDAIEATQAVIDQLQVVKKAIMAELLTRGLPGRHTKFKMTVIGEVPEEWSVVAAGSIFADGPSNGRSPLSRATPPGIPTFSIGAVREGRVNIHRNLKYAEGDPAHFHQVRVHRGDILIVRANGNSDLVGRCGVVSEEPPPGCIYPDILMRVRPTEEVLPAFLATLWNSEVVHAQVLDKAKTTNGTYKINGQDVRAILLPVPTREEQARIAELAAHLEERGAIEAASLESCTRVKSALMSVLLTGEVRVTPDEDAA